MTMYACQRMREMKEREIATGFVGSKAIQREAVRRDLSMQRLKTEARLLGDIY